MAKRQKICVIGTWHLGSVVSACLANLGYSVVGVDNNASTIEALKKGIPPLFEPGLEELIAKNTKARRLSYTTDLAGAVEGCRHALITYDTPVEIPYHPARVLMQDFTWPNNARQISTRAAVCVMISLQRLRRVCSQLCLGMSNIAIIPNSLVLSQSTNRF